MPAPRPNRQVVSLAVLFALALMLAASARPASSATSPLLVGSSSTYAYVDGTPGGQAEAFRTTATTSGTVSALRVYVDATAASGPITAGLYTDASSRHPGTLLASGSIGSRTVGAWNTVTFTATVSVTAGKTYWIAVLGASGSGALRFRDAHSQPAETSKSRALISLPTKWSTGKTSRDGGISAYAVALVVDTSAPTAPTGLGVSGVSGNSATLSWASSTDDVGVVGYDLYLNGAKVGTSASATTFTYSGLSCGATYSLAVDAYDAAGNVSPLSGTSVTTAACSDTVPPSAPLGLVAGVTGPSSATLSWGPATDNVQVTGYLILRNGAQVGATSGTGYTLTGLSCATQYVAGVAATDAAGNVSTTTTVTFITGACPDTAPPTMPTTLMTSSVGQTSAALSWNTSSDNVGVTAYRLFQNGTQVGTSIATNYIFGGLTCGTSYVFGVAAVDAAGNVSGTATTSVTTVACPDSVAPSTPTALATSSVSQTQATLSWSPSTDNVAVVGYRTFRGGTQVGAPTLTSYTFTGLTCGTTYTLGVAATDGAGNVSTTATTSVTTPSCPDGVPPTTPTGVVAGAAGQTSIPLSWNASTDNIGVTGYRLFRNGAQVGTSISASYIFGGLACGTSYTLGVAAVDGAGNASSTATTTAATATCGVVTSANVSLSPGGNDATCVRGDSAKPCATLAKAMTVAQAGDTVSVADGDYTTGCTISSSFATDVTVTGSPNARFICSLNFTTASHVVFDGPSPESVQFGAASSYITLQNVAVTCKDSAPYTLWAPAQLCNSRIGVTGSHQTLTHVTVGPSYDTSGCNTGQSDISKLTGGLNYATLTDVTFHDDRYAYTNCSGDQQHSENLYITNASNITIDRATFTNGANSGQVPSGSTTPNGKGPDTANILITGDAGPVSNLTLKNSVFVGATMASIAAQSTDLPNSLIANNTWTHYAYFENPTYSSTLRFVGNIGADQLCLIGPAVGSTGGSFSHNLWYDAQAGGQSQKCGSSDIGTGGSNITSSIFKDPAAGDLHLSSTSPALNAADPTTFPANDRDGALRPFGNGPDVGAYEYTGG